RLLNTISPFFDFRKSSPPIVNICLCFFLWHVIHLCKRESRLPVCYTEVDVFGSDILFIGVIFSIKLSSNFFVQRAGGIQINVSKALITAENCNSSQLCLRKIGRYI